MDKLESLFEKLSALNLNDKVEKKNSLTYLSWAWAWSEFKRQVPDATYEVVEYNGNPFCYDENLGYMVKTYVQANGETIPMHLPVLDGANKAMKNKPYKYSTKYGEKTVEAATMFDINTAIMRCLVKNIAMFGLALYIYAGEDLPESQEPKVPNNAPVVPPAKTSTPKVGETIATPTPQPSALQPSKEFNTLTDNKAEGVKTTENKVEGKLDEADVASTMKAFAKFDTAKVLAYLIKEKKFKYMTIEEFLRGESTVVIKEVYNVFNKK